MVPRRLWSALALAVAIGGAAAASDDLLARAIATTKSYADPRYSIYRPMRDTEERAASTVAISAHVMLEAYLAGGDAKFLDAARLSADSVLDHADMNEDGETGWGRYWKSDDKKGDRDGGNTNFAIGCKLARNAAYDDELYDVARITHFLLALHAETGDRRYLVGARRAIDDTWDEGEATLDGEGFVYDKTEGACDRGWHVKNINMLMAVPIALLGEAAGEAKYRDRALKMLVAERAELRRAKPNLGYYGLDTSAARMGSAGKYVESAHVIEDGGIRCHPETSTGRSCSYHLGLEARSLALAAMALGEPPQSWTPDVATLIGGLEARDTALCETAIAGESINHMACAAYYCVFRNIEARYGARCFARAFSHPVSQDTLLGIFWGERLFRRP